MTQLPAILSNLVGNLETAQKSTPALSDGDFLYLKMNKQGLWLYGAEETEVSPDSFFVVEPASYSQGYIAWDDGELVSEVMAVAGATPVTMADLPEIPVGVKWDSQTAFALKGIEGPDEGTQLLYKVSSRGGKAAISELLGKIIERAKTGTTDVCPVVTLDNSHYKHKKYGRIYTPVLAVDEWMDIAGPDDVEPEAEPVVEPPKKRARKKKAEPVVEEVVEEAEPPRRRRRSA